MTGGLEILDLVSRERVIQIKDHSKVSRTSLYASLMLSY